jgi:AAA+ superfamily predicted ATPase
MSVVEAIAPVGIEAEWARVEVLAHCLLRSRAGKQPEPELIAQLQRLQHQVDHVRRSLNNPWHKLPTRGLPDLAFDVLACVFACEAQMRIGWLYQELQPANPQPFITPALLHMLLALDDSEIQSLQALVGSEGGLKRRNLIESDDDGAFAVLRPVKSAVAVLMDWPQAEVTPPGAMRVRQRATWDELVLPADRERMLREFLLWLRHRDTVVNKWGGKAIGGPVALFSGPSGTGKTFAATVLATELDWPLYRVDLARLVSKYIGETEKNIGRLFNAAHGRNMVLQFDEVDALMSKRGEVKEARDRYANMEVSYLLARIEDHEGPCILTTNMRNQIDKAFTRRFQMVVEFPRPDEPARARLWSLLLPPRAPRRNDVDIDFLARALNLTGGNIRNAALHAAYLAADDGRAIGMEHIATAAWRELAKDRPRIAKSDLGPLAEFLPDTVYNAETDA